MLSLIEQSASPSSRLDALKNVKAFTRHDLIAGLPANLFFTGVMLSLGLGIALYWWVTPLIALAYYPVMYHIHKDDPLALSSWIKNLIGTPTCYHSGHYTTRKIIWLKSGGEQ